MSGDDRIGIEPPEQVVTTLQEHQKQALEFLWNRENNHYRGCEGGFLLDDAGLGEFIYLGVSLRFQGKR